MTDWKAEMPETFDVSDDGCPFMACDAGDTEKIVARANAELEALRKKNAELEEWKASVTQGFKKGLLPTIEDLRARIAELKKSLGDVLDCYMYEANQGDGVDEKFTATVQWAATLLNRTVETIGDGTAEPKEA